MLLHTTFSSNNPHGPPQRRRWRGVLEGANIKSYQSKYTRRKMGVGWSCYMNFQSVATNEVTLTTVWNCIVAPTCLDKPSNPVQSPHRVFHICSPTSTPTLLLPGSAIPDRLCISNVSHLLPGSAGVPPCSPVVWSFTMLQYPLVFAIHRSGHHYHH